MFKLSYPEQMSELILEGKVSYLGIECEVQEDMCIFD